MPPDKRKPFRIVLAWQGGWTALAASLAGWLGGRHAAVSAALGGAIAIAGCLAFAWLVGRNRALTADGILLTALRAEAVKVLVLFALLALVLATYKYVVVTALIGSFIVAIVIFGFAFFVRDA
jgi:ATP synthase protein I